MNKDEQTITGTIADVLSRCKCDFELKIVERCPTCEEAHRKPKKKSKWHDVVITRPQPYHSVLCKSHECSALLVCYIDGIGRWFLTTPYQEDRKLITISHWRELPKPPKES